MEERFLQQLKKGVLELLVLQTICRGPTYGYELIAQLGSRSGGLFTLFIRFVSNLTRPCATLL